MFLIRNLGASPLRGDRAFRSNLFCGCAAKKDFRCNPLRIISKLTEGFNFMKQDGIKNTKLLISLAAALALACAAGDGKAPAETPSLIPAESGLLLAPPAWLHGFWRPGPSLPAFQGKVFEVGDYIAVGKGGTFYAHSLAEMLRLEVYTGFYQKVSPERYEISYKTPLGRISEIFSIFSMEESRENERKNVERRILYTYTKNGRQPYTSYLVQDSDRAVLAALEQAGKKLTTSLTNDANRNENKTE
jgi:hypothetical protein